MSRHKVFISYHHDNDQQYRNLFERLFADRFDIMVSKSVNIGDIDPNNNTEYVRQLIRDNYIADATVIIVLIGQQTWQRKHVDWEISSGLRDTKNNSRCGLLGIFLPSYPGSKSRYNPYTIPPRLYDNAVCGYADLHDWPNSSASLSNWIETAFNKRYAQNPNNGKDMFRNNRSGDRWYS